MARSNEIAALESRFKESFDDVLISTLDGKDFTYGRFWVNAQGIADNWRNNGIKPGVNIALILPNSVSMLACYLACVIGGYIANPILTTLSQEEIEARLALTRPVLVIREPFELSQSVSLLDIENVRITTGSDSSFCVMFTSGTTGKPKGICHSLSGMIGSARSFANIAGMNKQTRIYHILPMAYMAGFINTFLAPLLSGGRIIEGSVVSAAAMLDFWERPVDMKVNTLCLTPTIAAMLCRLNRNRKDARKYAANLRIILSTAGVLHSGLRTEFMRIFGKPLQDCYGTTELGGPLTVQFPEDALVVENSGCPIPELDFSFRPAPGGENEMWIRSPYIMKGYLTEEGLSLPVDEQGFMATGDLAEIVDGNIIITGRCKDIIIRGAENIAPIVIENEISAVEGVKEVAVIGMPHEFWGEIVVVCILPEDNIEEAMLLNEVQLRASEYLSPMYQPDKIIAVKEFPRTFTGKVQKNILRNQLMIA